jgi:hypothetical protein
MKGFSINDRQRKRDSRVKSDVYSSRHIRAYTSRVYATAEKRTPTPKTSANDKFHGRGDNNKSENRIKLAKLISGHTVKADVVSEKGKQRGKVKPAYIKSLNAIPKSYMKSQFNIKQYGSLTVRCGA